MVVMTGLPASRVSSLSRRIRLEPTAEPPGISLEAERVRGRALLAGERRVAGGDRRPAWLELDPDRVTAEVDRHLDDLRASQRLPGFEAIRLPGDRREQCKAERLREGVPIAPPLMTELDRLAERLGVEPLMSR